ncbi:MAG: alpha/beta fold hydrolase [Burkholderiales bacterium]
MPYADAGGIKLYYEEVGRGTPIIFVHEFSGSLESWEAQLRYFSRRYRCIAFNARGYPPSDVPKALSHYSYQKATDDIAVVMRHLGLRKAHIVGCSMGAYSTLQFGLRHPRLARSLTVVGAGAGSNLAKRAEFLRNTEAQARRFLAQGMPASVTVYRTNPSRVPLLKKDPRGFAEFYRRVEQHSALGSANTQRGIQAKRPPIYALERALRRLTVPTHVICGDEDDANLDPALFIKRVCSAAWLTVVGGTGHVVNLEEPALFNTVVGDFLALVDSGRWRPRDPRSLNPSTMAKKR